MGKPSYNGGTLTLTGVNDDVLFLAICSGSHGDNDTAIFYGYYYVYSSTYFYKDFKKIGDGTLYWKYTDTGVAGRALFVFKYTNNGIISFSRRGLSYSWTDSIDTTGFTVAV